MADMFTKTASETERGSPLELRLASVGSHTKQIPGEGRHDLHLHQVPLQDLSECVSVCVRARVSVCCSGERQGDGTGRCCDPSVASICRPSNRVDR